MGEERYKRFLAAFEEEAPVSLRINPLKCVGQPVDGERVPWCDEGYYLPHRPNFTFDPLFHAGCYYVQEASSMFVWRVLKQYAGSKPVMALDMCAAPGGKTTAAQAALPEGSVIMCNEPMRPRANILAENISKWGAPRVIVTNNYPADYAKSGLKFDVIICDVPCSGEGMFRKDEGAIGEWSVQNVENCCRLQREIVADAWSCLRPGGLMVYSTCTLNTREDEENVAWICSELGAEVLPVDVKDDWHICGSLLDGFQAPVYRFIPGTTRGEGLFMVALRKPADGEGEADESDSRMRRKAKKDTAQNSRNNKKGAGGETLKAMSGWLSGSEEYDIINHGDSIVAIPKAMKDIFDAASSLRIVHAGVTLGEVKGKDIIPHQSLALSSALSQDAFPTVALDYRQAVDYLRKEAIGLPEGTPRGFVLVTFRGIPLGFMKNIGNRANNLYPQEWKIKTTHLPETEQPLLRF